MSPTPTLDRLIAGFERMVADLKKLKAASGRCNPRLDQHDALLAVCDFFREVGFGDLTDPLDEIQIDIADSFATGNRKKLAVHRLHQEAADAVDLLLQAGEQLDDALRHVASLTQGALSPHQLKTLRANYRSRRITGSDSYSFWARGVNTFPLDERPAAARMSFELLAKPSVKRAAERLARRMAQKV